LDGAAGESEAVSFEGVFGEALEAVLAAGVAEVSVAESDAGVGVGVVAGVVAGPAMPLCGGVLSGSFTVTIN